MHTKLFVLILAIGLAGTCIVNAQSPTESASPAKKHRVSKKAAATASPAEEAASRSTAESPSASPKAKRGRKKTEAATVASPAESPSAAASPATSPKGQRARKKAEAAASPVASASPAKFNLGDLFKPKTSAAATSPAAASPAPATGASTEGATNPPAPGGGHGLVWVNTETHVYHREGSRFYGTTKKGKYMSEADAIKEGDRAAAKGH